MEGFTALNCVAGYKMREGGLKEWSLVRWMGKINKTKFYSCLLNGGIAPHSSSFSLSLSIDVSPSSYKYPCCERLGNSFSWLSLGMWIPDRMKR